VGICRKGFDKLVVHWSGSITSHFGRPFSLTPYEQVLVFFWHLRHYTANLLAKVFGVCRSTISNIISTILIFFDKSLSHIISMGTEESRMREGVYWFNQLITWVMDGSEQQAHSSKNIFLENNLFSSKKNQHSLTILLIISPNGCILFISVCFYGSVIDFELVLRTHNKWYS